MARGWLRLAGLKMTAYPVYEGRGVCVTNPRARAERRTLLSKTDAKVLEGVAVGDSTVRLANRLFLSRQGVDYHVGTLLRRFRCPNRPALVARAYAQGVLLPGSWPPSVTADCVR